MVRGPRFREDLLELPEVADEQALRGSAVELGDPFDNALEISAHRVGKPGPRWTEAAHRADARAKCYSKVNVTSSVKRLLRNPKLLRVPSARPGATPEVV